jgi:hypothetical protein
MTNMKLSMTNSQFRFSALVAPCRANPLREPWEKGDSFAALPRRGQWRTIEAPSAVTQPATLKWFIFIRFVDPSKGLSDYSIFAVSVSCRCRSSLLTLFAVKAEKGVTIVLSN